MRDGDSKNPNRRQTVRLVRRSAAIISAILGTRLVFSSVEDAGLMISAGKVIFGVALCVFAAILFTPDSVPFASGIFTRFIDLIYSPGENIPPLDYELASRFVAKQRYNAAVREYLKIAHYYPQEFRAYYEAIRVSLLDADKESAATILRKAMRCLKSRNHRLTLQNDFSNLLD